MSIESETYRILKSRKSICFLLFILLIPFVDLFMNTYSVFNDYIKNPEVYGGVLSHSMVLHPSLAAFLSGSSQGHIAQMLLIWPLPLYLLIIYGDSYIQEKNYGYHNILYSRSSRKHILRIRFGISFLLPFIVSLVSLTINFLLSNLIFNGGNDLRGAEQWTQGREPFIVFSFNHLTEVYILYIIVYSVITGLCGIMCTGLSFVLPNYKAVYSVSFFLWFVQIISPYSLTYAIQPFIEYGPRYFIPALLIFLTIVTGITLISVKYKVACDEF